MLPQVTIISVPNTTYQTSATGDGVTTSFGFTWTATEEDQVQVYLAGILQVSGYTTVLSNITAGGTVFFNAAPTSGVAILLQRSSDLLQNEVLLDNAPLPASTIESMADKLTIIAQQQATQINECIQLPPGTTGISVVLPAPVADGVLAWNSAGTAIAYISAPFAPATTVPFTIAIWDGTTNQLLDNGPAVGTRGQALFSSGSGAPPIFSAAPNVAGTVLTSNGIGSYPTYQAAPAGPGSGNVNGPGSAVVDSIALWGNVGGTALLAGVSLGTSGQILTSNGPGNPPAFQTAAAGITGPGAVTKYTLPMWDTTDADLLAGPALGTSGQVLTSAGAGNPPAFQTLPAASFPVWTFSSLTFGGSTFAVPSTNGTFLVLDYSGSGTTTGTLPALSGLVVGSTIRIKVVANANSQTINIAAAGSDQISYLGNGTTVTTVNIASGPAFGGIFDFIVASISFLTSPVWVCIFY